MRTRTPFATGSSGGFVRFASVDWPTSASLSSPGGVKRFTIVILCLNAPAPPVHGSHASPRLAASPFALSVFGIDGQLSMASQTVSPSVSGRPVSAGQSALEPVHDSATSQVPVEDRQTVPDGARASAGQ